MCLLRTQRTKRERKCEISKPLHPVEAVNMRLGVHGLRLANNEIFQRMYDIRLVPHGSGRGAEGIRIHASLLLVV